jgi:hypothetical protein
MKGLNGRHMIVVVVAFAIAVAMTVTMARAGGNGTTSYYGGLPDKVSFRADHVLVASVKCQPAAFIQRDQWLLGFVCAN